MRRLGKYITGKEWALFVTAVTALLTQLPALIELIEGELDRDDWTPIGLLVIIAGWAIRSNVFRTATYDRDVAAAFDAGRIGVDRAQTPAGTPEDTVVANLRVHGFNVQLPADDDAETERLERLRRGEPE